MTEPYANDTEKRRVHDVAYEHGSDGRNLIDAPRYRHARAAYKRGWQSGRRDFKAFMGRYPSFVEVYRREF